MSKAKRPSRKREMSPVHAHAAAVDIGATLNVAAVGPDRDPEPEPVRSFGTFTADLHRMADWFERCGVRTVAMEKHRGLLDPGLRGSGAARVRGGAGQRPRRQARAGPQDGRERR